MTLDEAIKHCEEVADGLTEQGKCTECAEEHKQLAEWLKELKQLKEQKPYVTTRKLSDNELKHLVEQMEKERWQFISVKQDHCDDAISRKAAKAKIKSICNEYRLAYEDGERISGSAYAFGHAFDDLPSVSPQPKMGYWTRVADKTGHLVWECGCGWQQRFHTNFCPDCGIKMREVEE